MAISAEYKEFLADLFADVGPLVVKRFFGTDGLNVDGVLLGFVVDEQIYLRTDPKTKPLFEAERCKPFSFEMKGETVVTAYFAIPDRLYDEPDEFAGWARRAIEAARNSKTQVKKRAKQAKKVAAPRKPAKRRRS
ncbi:MAG: hypothetical protein GC166_06495 [Alphaproteobacteria bacterium]|nr:hypothetical protein [Alphaproteobacteria bacterium]